MAGYCSHLGDMTVLANVSSLGTADEVMVEQVGLTFDNRGRVMCRCSTTRLFLVLVMRLRWIESVKMLVFKG